MSGGREMKNMNRKSFLLAGGLVMLTALGAAFLAAPYVRGILKPAGEIMPMWAHSYSDLEGMLHDVDVVALATVQSIDAGRIAFGSGDSMPVPFTEIEMKLDRVYLGELSDSFTIERTGGEIDGHSFYLDGDGGAYAVGEQVLVFLNRQTEDGFYYLVNPQGRFLVKDGRLLAAEPRDPVAQVLDTLSLEEASAVIQRLL